MANLSVTFTRTSPAGSISRNKDYSDADLDRLNAAVTAELQEQGIASPTNGQIADYLFDRVKADFKTFTRNSEDRAANVARTTIGL
jgi:hypothetical protein